jgi:serpin B
LTLGDRRPTVDGMTRSTVLPWLIASAVLAFACEPGATGRSSPQGDVGPSVAVAHDASIAPSDPAPTTVTALDLDTPAAATAVESDVHQSNAFAFKLLGRNKKPNDNMMLSATSIRFALAAPYIGARGTTAREMASALSLDSDPKAAARLAHAELGAWQEARGNAELSIANRLWVDDGFTLLPDFIKIAESAFGATPASIDFGKPAEARSTINRWVSEKTKDKIPELLPEGSIDPSTRLVVTNAIWFKGRWELPFSKSATKDEPFKLDAKKNVTVPSMHLTDTFRVAQLPNLKVLEMRYAESRIAMLVALPNDAGTGALAKLESSLSADTITQWNGALSSGRVNVTLPRFSFRSGGSMGGLLRDLGMRVAFTEKADFSGIAESHGGERLFVGDVFHQTWISVDEIGTEAAAATGTTMRTTSLITGPVVEFHADHPFLFVIEDTKTARVLFVGQVANPKTP